MLSEHISIDTAGINTNLGGKNTPQSGAVEECSTAYDLSDGQARVLLGKVGQNVDWVGDEKNDGVVAVWFHVVRCGSQNGQIPPE